MDALRRRESGLPKRRGALRWLWMPFALLWAFATALEKKFGIVATLALGLVFLVVGMLLVLSIAGLPAGIPACLLGLFLVLRALY
jgi:uncharacterized metal-binding protein